MRKSRSIPLKSKTTFAFVVDGNTEIWYLQMLKRNEKSIPFNIEPKIPQKKSLADQFEKVKELSKDYTKVFWIVDLDVVITESKATKIGNKSSIQSFVDFRKTLLHKFKNVEVIVNNPCLEFWFLLHFEASSKYFDTCYTAEKQLKKHLKDYEKTQKFQTKQNQDIYLILKPFLANAIYNSKKLQPIEENNPYKATAEMYKIFDALKIISAV